VETVDSRQHTVDREKTFMQLSSLQGSILENRIFEDDFHVESISTAKLFSIVGSRQNTVDRVDVLTIDKSNIATVLPTLPFDDNVKEDITNSVNQNLVVRIPQSEITYHDWSGIGYIKENPETGESGWMLSGMIAGGMNSISPSEWVDQHLADTLGNPEGIEPNDDPLAGATIMRVPPSDYQFVTVGKVMDQPNSWPLMVIVKDKKGLPVENAAVTFRIIDGGGYFVENGQRTQEITVQTSSRGVAEAKPVVGEKTSVNPNYYFADSHDTYSTQVGENLITAWVQTHAGPLHLTGPFAAYGKPDVDGPDKTIRTVPNKTIQGLPNASIGALTAVLEDQHKNPISNVDLVFTVQQEVEPVDPLWLVPTGQPGFRSLTLFKMGECSALYPLYEDCQLVAAGTKEIKTQFFGSMVETILGNTYGTRYTVAVTAPLPDVPVAKFTIETLGSRGTDPSFYFPAYTWLSHQEASDYNGRPITAAKIGTELKAPLTAAFYLQKDEIDIDATFSQPTFSCTIGGQQTQCRRIKTTGIVKVEKITNGTVTFLPVIEQNINGQIMYIAPELVGMAPNTAGTVTTTENLQNGSYQTRYTASPEPRRNRIEAWGDVMLHVPEVFWSLGREAYYIRDVGPDTIPTREVTIRTGQLAQFDPETLQPMLQADLNMPYYDGGPFTVYGVKLQASVEPGVILLNSENLTTSDLTVRYSILPEDYYAFFATVRFYKKDANDVEEWYADLVGDSTQGQGKAVVSWGSLFDVQNRYEAVAALNPGTSAEVLSERKTVPLAQLKVLTDESTPQTPDEIKFGDGSNAKKRYKIELESRALMDTCVSLSGTIRTIDKNGQPIIVPGAQDEYYAAKCPLDFHPTTDGKCLVTVDTEGGKEKFILSNLSKAVLEDRNTVDDDTAVLYGSIGNTVQVEINGAKKELPIEPVGVMVLAIDGLRQDVLYPAGEQQVYPSGMQSPYYIEPDRLKGLCDIFGGKRGWLSCDPDGWENRHIRLQSVTAIFPSITLASWASIFTGMMPGTTLDSNGNNIGGTGILGNEFFARDLYGQNIGLPRYLDSTGVYQRKFNPEGIVSFGSGAFRGYDQYTHVEKLTDQSFFIPYQLNWEEPISPVRTATAQGTPQNDPAILRPQTIFESITGEPGMTDVKKYFKERGGDSVVVANNHYARGAYWLTWDLNLFFSSAETLDAQSWDKFDDYLKGKYTDGILGILGRNKIPFSALSVWYLPGLDHQAHVNGMGAYKNYFITTDTYIAELVDRLKKTLDEFDNKIFIIVADHGHTAMPLPEQMTLEEKDENGNVVKTWYGDASDELKLEKFGNKKIQFPERANNNLHIWELGEALRALQEKKPGLSYRVLAPEKIAELFIDTPAGARKNLDLQPDLSDTANVVAAFNGPMAHIYFRGQNGWQDSPNPEELKKFADVLRVLYQVESFSEAQSALGIDMVDYLNLLENTIGRMKQSVDKLLIRIGEEYLQFNGYVANGYAVGPLSFTAEYVKAIERVGGLNHPTRSGDIVLIMKDSASEIALNRFTTGVAAKSWHGSLNASDSYVPMIVAYPGGNKYELTPLIDGTQGCNATQGCDGNWRVADLIKTILQQQFGSQ
jgi:hypothetical protein